MLTTDPSPATSEFDQVLTDVCNQNLSLEMRQARFATLLGMSGGPFLDSDRSMYESVKNLARRVSAEELRKRRLPISCLDVEEVAHEALTVFFVNCSKIRGAAKLRPWLWTVMRVRASKLLRESRPFREASDLTIVEREHHSSIGVVKDEQPTDASDAKARVVELAVSELSPRLREVAILHGVNGYSHEQIARTLGTTAATVRVRWHRAKRALSARLSPALQISP